MNESMNVDVWVALFREIGLSGAQMEHWHRLLEHRHPSCHQAFLEWLGLPSAEIDRIRTKSRRDMKR
jgi:hypothetical protein